MTRITKRLLLALGWFSIFASTVEAQEDHLDFELSYRVPLSAVEIEARAEAFELATKYLRRGIELSGGQSADPNVFVRQYCKLDLHVEYFNALLNSPKKDSIFQAASTLAERLDTEALEQAHEIIDEVYRDYEPEDQWITWTILIVEYAARHYACQNDFEKMANEIARIKTEEPIGRQRRQTVLTSLCEFFSARGHYSRVYEVSRYFDSDLLKSKWQLTATSGLVNQGLYAEAKRIVPINIDALLEQYSDERLQMQIEKQSAADSQREEIENYFAERRTTLENQWKLAQLAIMSNDYQESPSLSQFEEINSISQQIVSRGHELSWFSAFPAVSLLVDLGLADQVTALGPLMKSKQSGYMGQAGYDPKQQPLIQLATNLFREGKQESAQQIVASLPKSPWKSAAWQQMAEVALESGDETLAIGLLDAAFDEVLDGESRAAGKSFFESDHKLFGSRFAKHRWEKVSQVETAALPFEFFQALVDNGHRELAMTFSQSIENQISVAPILIGSAASAGDFETVKNLIRDSNSIKKTFDMVRNTYQSSNEENTIQLVRHLPETDHQKLLSSLLIYCDDNRFDKLVKEILKQFKEEEMNSEVLSRLGKLDQAFQRHTEYIDTLKASGKTISVQDDAWQNLIFRSRLYRHNAIGNSIVAGQTRGEGAGISTDSMTATDALSDADPTADKAAEHIIKCLKQIQVPETQAKVIRSWTQRLAFSYRYRLMSELEKVINQLPVESQIAFYSSASLFLPQVWVDRDNGWSSYGTRVLPSSFPNK